MEFSNHGSVTRMANMITLRSCSSKWVNNQMEVNDRPMQKWRWWCKTHPRLFEAEKIIFTTVFYRRLVHFLMSLNSGGTCAHCLYLFFNEHEVHIKTARLIQSYYRNVSYKNGNFSDLCPTSFLYAS